MGDREPLGLYVTIPDAGHASNQDNPLAFTAQLGAFLDRELVCRVAMSPASSSGIRDRRPTATDNSVAASNGGPDAGKRPSYDPLVRTMTWPLVGRADEVTAIQDAIRPPDAGAGVVVAGAAGVGKTRLAREALDEREPQAGDPVGRRHGLGANVCPWAPSCRCWGDSDRTRCGCCGGPASSCWTAHKAGS